MKTIISLSKVKLLAKRVSTLGEANTTKEYAKASKLLYNSILAAYPKSGGSDAFVDFFSKVKLASGKSDAYYVQEFTRLATELTKAAKTVPCTKTEALFNKAYESKFKAIVNHNFVGGGFDIGVIKSIKATANVFMKIRELAEIIDGPRKPRQVATKRRRI